MMAAHVSTYCPSVYVGGACCAACAAGSGCGGALAGKGQRELMQTIAGCPALRVSGACCEACAHGAPCAGAVESVGALGAESFVPWDPDVIASATIVQRFNADVVSAPQIDPSALQMRWNMWFANWQIFYATADQQGSDRLLLPKGLYDQDVDGVNYFATYKVLMAQFNSFVDEWRKAGGTTSVSAVDTRSPLEKGVSSLTDTAASSLSGAVSTLVTVGLYGVAITGVAALGFLAWPYVLRAIAARSAA